MHLDFRDRQLLSSFWKMPAEFFFWCEMEKDLQKKSIYQELFFVIPSS